MRLVIVNSIRRFVSAGLFCIAGIFNAVNIAVFNPADSVRAILLVIWDTLWCTTAAHQFFYRAVTMKRTVDNPANSPVLKDQILRMRRSTHSHIKAALTTATAVSALVMDSYQISRDPSPIRITRVLGSVTWISVGILEIWMAVRHERKQENNPDRTIQPLGIRPSVYHVAHDVAYLLAGVLYAHDAWTNFINATQPLSETWVIPVPNTCWLIAGINELSRNTQNVISETQAQSNAASNSDNSGEKKENELAANAVANQPDCSDVTVIVEGAGREYKLTS